MVGSDWLGDCERNMFCVTCEHYDECDLPTREDEELSEDEIDEIHDMWHPNETQEEFAEHENFDD